MSRQGFTSVDYRDAPPAAFTAFANSTTKGNLWNPALWTFFPAFTLKAGQVWLLDCGGIISCTGTPTIIFDVGFGQNNSSPPTNTSFGASRTLTLGSGLTNVPWRAQFHMVVRSLGVAASGMTLVGNGQVNIQGVAAAVDQDISLGGTDITTADDTTAQGLAVAVTWGTASASNTIQAKWCLLRSLN